MRRESRKSVCGWFWCSEGQRRHVLAIQNFRSSFETFRNRKLIKSLFQQSFSVQDPRLGSEQLFSSSRLFQVFLTCPKPNFSHFSLNPVSFSFIVIFVSSFHRKNINSNLPRLTKVFVQLSTSFHAVCPFSIIFGCFSSFVKNCIIFTFFAFCGFSP